MITSNIITRIVLLSIFIAISFKGISQTAFRNDIFIDFNRSMAGSGDLSGVFVDFGYKHYFKKKLFWYGEFGANTDYGEKYIRYSINNQPEVDASVRYVTSGMQFGGGLGYSPLHTSHNIMLKIGGLFRYQASSIPSVLDIYIPAPSGNPPTPVVAFQHYEKGRIYSIGYKLNIGYTYIFSKKIFAGVNAFLQNDTNADTYYGYGLTVGKRF